MYAAERRSDLGGAAATTTTRWSVATRTCPGRYQLRAGALDERNGSACRGRIQTLAEAAARAHPPASPTLGSAEIYERSGQLQSGGRGAQHFDRLAQPLDALGALPHQS